jgi:TIR domain-containing protein
MESFQESQLMIIAEDFRFSEEVFELIKNYKEDEVNPSNFNISLSTTRDCERLGKKQVFLKGTKICIRCYYSKVLDKLLSIRKSKRKEFIEYQMNLRIHKQIFLNEIEELITDNEAYFDQKEFGFCLDYLNAIKELKRPKRIESISKGVKNDDKNLAKRIEIKNIKMQLDVFISHSSMDAVIAKYIIELLRNAFHIKANKIRCTYVDGYKLTGGVSTDMKLNEEIRNNRLFIGLLSKESLVSTYVLFEMGARWGLQLPLKLIVFDTSVFSLIKSPLDNIHIINISNVAEIHQLLDEVELTLGMEREPTSSYLTNINNLLEQIQQVSK